MKLRHWIAVVAISTACVVSLAALQSPSAELVSPTDPGILIKGGNGKGKGPKCKHEVFCDPQRCEQYDCGHLAASSCDCVCVPIPDCVPVP